MNPEHLCLQTIMVLVVQTTAALGLAVRTAGAGLRVYFAQFVKGMKYSELVVLEKLSEYITVKQYGLMSAEHLFRTMRK